MISRTWLIAAALLLTSVAAAPAQITEEAVLSEPQYGPAPGDQSRAVVATDGRDFLVAWVDERAMPVAIYANRVTHDGRVLDGTGIRIPLEQPTFPDGRLIGVFYVDGAYTILYSYQWFGWPSSRAAVAVISTDGRLINGPRTIFDDANLRASATNGSRIVLVAVNQIVVLNGRAQIVDRFALPTVPAYGSGIASNGSTFLVGTFSLDNVSNQWKGVNLIALDGNGKPTDITSIATGASGDSLVIGSDGSDYVVTYSDGRTFKPVAQYVGAHAEIRSTTIIDSAPYSLAPGALVWTGRTYLAAATATRRPDQQMELLSLDRSGTPIAPARPLGGTPGAVNQAAMAWNGTNALLTWTSGSQNAPEAWEVVGALTNADATSISPVITIPSSSNLQVTPVIATSGSQDLAVWIEPNGIYATRITPDGRALDGRGITVSSATQPSRLLTVIGVPSPSRPVQPAVRAIYDGSSYLVAWGGSNGVTGQRVDPATGSLVGSPIALAPCSRSFDLAKDNDSPVLFTVNCSDWRVYAQRVGATAPLGAAVAVSPSDMLASAPRAAWNGNGWLVVWNKLIQSGLLISPPFYYAPAVYAARVSPELTLLDVQPILIAESEFGEEDSPLVATDGREFLVIWSHRVFNANGLSLRRVQPDGSLRDAEVLLPGSLAAKSIVWNGARYTIGYSRSDGSWNEDLFLTHVSSRNDEPSTRDQVMISATLADERFISLVAPPGRPVRVVYTRVAAEPQYGGVSRVFMRDEISLRRRAVRPH